MKLVGKDIVRDGPGTIKLILEDEDDVWHAYNLMSKSDKVSAFTSRKIAVGGGSTSTERVKLTMEVKAEEITYESKDSPYLRVRGRCTLVNDYVNVGQYHTIELGLDRPFNLKKEVWDSVAIDILRRASDPSPTSADVIVILMQEGLANIFHVGDTMTRAGPTIVYPIPKKTGRSNGQDAAMKRFFDSILQTFSVRGDFSTARCVVIASPGSTKDRFRDYILSHTEKSMIGKNKSRLVLVKSSSGCKRSLKEVLENPAVMSMIKDTRTAKEVQVMKDFSDLLLTTDQDRVCYGPKSVEIAHEWVAIKTLLITDGLIRDSDAATRRKYVEIIESVKNSGGTAYVFSSLNVAGEQLAQFTGIAAILRFPVPEPDEIL